MITPLDIENKKFSKQMMNGYNVDEVDDFLDDLTVDYEKLYKENSELKTKLSDIEENLDKYKKQAIAILKFGISYNRKKAAGIDFSSCYICNELGALKIFKDEDFYELIVFVDIETNDAEIKSLISQLPHFNKY